MKYTVSKVLTAFIAFHLHLVSAEFCQSATAAWQCTCGCCGDYDYCCVSCSSYWYAWLIMTLLFLVCLCSCLGCGSYGYRRYRRTSLPASYIVTHRTPGYGSAPTPNCGYKQPTTAQATNYQPYQMPTSTTETGYHNYRQRETGYHGTQPGQAPSAPPPYNPSQAPPPYSAY